MNHSLQLTPGRITSILLSTVAFLLVANLGGIFLRFVLEKNYGFIHTFYFNREANVPAFYSSLAILISAVLLLAIAKLKNEKEAKRVLFWKVLGFVFIFLALDEFLSIHEGLSTITRNMIGESNAKGYLYYAWFIPYCMLFGLLFVLLAKSFLQLPNRTKILFIAAGVLFVGGAVGMEMVGGRYELMYGKSDLGYALLVTVEELMEMLGIILFIYALSAYYVENLPRQSMNLHIQLSKQYQSESKTDETAWQNAALPELTFDGSTKKNKLQTSESAG